MRRYTLPLLDRFRHSPSIRKLAGMLMVVNGMRPAPKAVRARRLTRALEFLENPKLAAPVIGKIHQMPGFQDAPVWQQALLQTPRYARVLRDDPGLSRSILLKAPGADGEKGILLMTFEYNWVRLLTGLGEAEFRWLDDHYDLVLSTSWSTTDYAALACAVSRVRGTVYVQSCNYSEIPLIEAFHPRLKCLPTLPCDWINPQLYRPLPFKQRTTDIVMVANWGEFKRHWDLFRALAQMPAKLKVVLIGQREPGRNQDFIRSLAREFGVRQELEIHESIPVQEVAAHQAKAKVSVIMSRREGCCVAAVESLFAGCCLAMREDAHVGPLAYINEHSGKKLRPSHLAEDLMNLLHEAEQKDPHAWAATHVDGFTSHKKVNDFFKEAASAIGRPWHNDIIQPQWRPHPTYVVESEKEKLRPAMDELHRRFPALFPGHLLDSSWK